MEEQPISPSLPENQPIVSQPQKKRSIVQLLILIVLVLALGGWVGFWVNKTVVKVKTVPVVTPTPQQIQSTPAARKESQIASQSAFLTVSDAIASLSSSISTYTLVNTELDAPAIELPLGFSDK